jgi:hypothetical protein
VIRSRFVPFLACIALVLQLAPSVRAFQDEGGESKTENKEGEKDAKD